MNFRIIAIGVVVATMSMAAAANECQAVIELVDANLTSTAPVTSEQFAQAAELRNRAVEFCTAGDVAGGLALLEQAKTILGIE